MDVRSSACARVTWPNAHSSEYWTSRAIASCIDDANAPWSLRLGRSRQGWDSGGFCIGVGRTWAANGTWCAPRSTSRRSRALLPTQRHPANPEQAAGDEAANRSISKLRPSEDGLRLLIFLFFSGLVARFTRSIRPRPSARSHYCPMLLEAPMTGIANCSGS